MFVSEDAAVDEAEHHGRTAHGGQYAPEPHALFLQQEKAEEHEHRALAHIPEHEPEEQAVGDEHEDARVALPIGGGAVHLHEGRKDAGEEALAELDRHVADVRMAGLVEAAGAAEPVGGGLEGLKPALGQPAAEVEILPAHGGKAAQVVRLAHETQPGVAAEQVRPFPLAQRVELGGKLGGLTARVLSLLPQLDDALGGDAGEAGGIGCVLRLEAEVAQPVLLPQRRARQGQQDAADPPLAEAGAEEEGPAFVLSLGADLVPELLLYGAEAELKVLHGQQLLQIDGEQRQGFEPAYELLVVRGEA